MKNFNCDDSPFTMIASDIKRYMRKDLGYFVCFMNASQGIFFSFMFRTIHYLYCLMYPTKLKILSQFLNFIYKIISSIFFGIEIEIQTHINKGIFITHRGIIIAAEKIGNNFTVFGPVTIGYKISIKNNKIYGLGRPTIGNNVTVFSGARIIGPVKIGNNVIVGTNAVVLKDIPNNYIVGGIPAKKIGLNNQKSIK